MCEISIRTMTVQDYPLFDVMESALHRMHQQARPDLFAELAHPCSRAEFSQMIQDSHRELFLAEWKGKPAGIFDGTTVTFRCIVDDEVWTLTIHEPKGDIRIFSDLCRQIITDAEADKLEESEYIKILKK